MAGKSGNRESMVKGLSIERREERPPCPDCGASNPTSRGVSWVCKKCGRGYQKIIRGRARKDLPDRPKSCIYCGAKELENGELVIWANGERWWCRVCGKSWIKERGKHKKRKDMGERPICPYCGTSDPQSNGVRWICVNPKCGKSWYKIYQNPPQPILSPTELITAKIVEA